MRILWVKIGGLWPLNSGGRLRSFNLLRELSGEHAITVVTTREKDCPPGTLRRQLPACREIIEIPYRPVKRGDTRFPFVVAKSWVTGMPIDMQRARVPELGATVESRLETGGFDLCLADFLCALPNIPLDGDVPVVLFEHNVEHMIWKRLARARGIGPSRMVLENEWRRVRRYEKRACERVERTVTVSHADRDLLHKMVPDASIFAVPTGVDTLYFSPRPEVCERKEVVFVGSMDWYPNEDAMRWFVAETLPALRRRVPDVAVTVVGRNPSPKFTRDMQVHGVHVTGTVADVRDFLARAAVCVVPLRIGGGTRLKIFEGLAMGKATVTTTVGAEGLPLVDGRHVVFADRAPDFAERIAGLIFDATRRKQLGEAGRDLVVKRYAWRRVAEEFALLCQTSCARRIPAGMPDDQERTSPARPKASRRADYYTP